MSDAARLPRTMAVIQRGMDEGLHIGAQLYVSLKSETVADVAIGEARPGLPMSTGTLMVWLSSTKPITAVATAQAWEQGKLDLDDPVMKHVPEFGQLGKESITIRHLLTHTAGIRGVRGRWENQSWQQIIETVCQTRLEPGWEPGKKAGYHASSSWYMLAEILRRLDPRARPFQQYVRDEIFIPIGMMDSWIGMPIEKYREYGDRIGLLHDTAKAEVRASSRETEVSMTTARPGANGRGPIRELGLFYEMMCNRGAIGEKRIIAPETAEMFVARQRIGMYDYTFKHVIDWGLGFIINSNQYGADTVPYGYGTYASPATFGHSGHQSSTGFCDPQHGLVVAWVMNGMPGDEKHESRLRAIDRAIYEDLGLA